MLSLLGATACGALISSSSFFFFNDTATTEIYTLSLHDALPISDVLVSDLEMPDKGGYWLIGQVRTLSPEQGGTTDRKSTRLNSSHSQISYAVFCLKKKKIQFNYAIQLHARNCQGCGAGASVTNT